MRFTKFLRGDAFGNLNTDIRRQVTHHISQHEGRVLATVHPFNYLRNLARRMLFIAPPFIFMYMVRDWAIKENTRLNRKQPGQFDNESPDEE
ncbi:hypothetical protein SNEBB_010587 [Seison nebaliae]|nr:hypothetical protein SNEBB_010587 [Seison nebaliae]